MVNERLRPIAKRLIESTPGGQTGLSNLLRERFGLSLSQSGLSRLKNGGGGTSYPVALALCQLAGVDPATVGLHSPGPDESIVRELRRPFAEVRRWFFHTAPVVEAFEQRDDYTVEDLLALHATPHLERGLTVEKVHDFVAEHRAGVIKASEEIVDPEAEVAAAAPKLLPAGPPAPARRPRRN